jgi:hypothetical protein
MQIVTAVTPYFAEADIGLKTDNGVTPKNRIYKVNFNKTRQTSKSNI